MQDAYPFLFTLGALAGLLWSGLATLRSRGTRIGSLHAVDAGLTALAAGLVGARAGYVATSWSYYSQRPQEALWFWQGGLSWASGAAGALLGLGVYSGISQRPFWALADRSAVPAAMLALTAWMGCLFDGCSYGWRVAPGPLAPPAPDLLGIMAPRWPTQAVGVITSLGALAVLIMLSGRALPRGALACLSLTLVAVTCFGLSFARADPVPVLWGLRGDGLASGVLAALGLIGLGHRLRQRPAG